MALPTKLTLEIVTPGRALVNEEVDEVELPGSEGYFGVLPGHTELLPSLQVGELWYRKGQTKTYLATDADEKVLKQVVEAVGDDNIVVSTDYPHSDGLFPHAIEEFVAIEGVSDKTKAKILWDNCARLYKLDSGR